MARLLLNAPTRLPGPVGAPSLLVPDAVRFLFAPGPLLGGLADPRWTEVDLAGRPVPVAAVVGLPSLALLAPPADEIEFPAGRFLNLVDPVRVPVPDVEVLRPPPPPAEVDPVEVSGSFDSSPGSKGGSVVRSRLPTDPVSPSISLVLLVLVPVFDLVPVLMLVLVVVVSLEAVKTQVGAGSVWMRAGPHSFCFHIFRGPVYL